jgi:hypothetical protein
VAVAVVLPITVMEPAVVEVLAGIKQQVIFQLRL